MITRKSILQTALLFGMAGGIICVTYYLFLSIIGVDNPFGRFRYLYSFFYALAFIGFYSHFRFQKKVSLNARYSILSGVIITLGTSVSGGLLIFSWLSNAPSTLEAYKKDALLLLDRSKEHILETSGKTGFQTTFENLSQITPFEMATDLSLSFLLWGIFLTFLFTLFFRTFSK